jgi:serine/threonine protein kinase
VRGDREKRAAALREVYVHGRCSSHGNVVEFREAFVGQKTIAIAMEYAPNGTLHDLIASRRAGDHLPENHIMFWFACALSAVGFMHRHGVVHRDVKLANCLVNGNSTLLLADFGLAAHVDKAKMQSDRGDFFGTPESLPPEVLAGQPHSFEGDIWSLGVLLYALAALRVPLLSGRIVFFFFFFCQKLNPT